jgi:hypothetical protein
MTVTLDHRIVLAIIGRRRDGVWESIVKHCRFRTSFGGSQYCQDADYLEGFCKFHFKALQAGEINEFGVINERLSDQNRRREINYHGIDSEGSPYLDERA